MASSSENDSEGAIHVESAKRFQQLLATERSVLVDFYAEWCGPCQMMADTIEELGAESEAAVLKVDVDELPAVAATYDVRSIPTFVAFEDGEPTDRFVGMQEKAALEAALTS